MPDYATVNRGNLAAQIAHAPGDAANVIVKLEAERDRYRQAIDDAIDELMCGDTKTAMAVLERALNQEDR